MSSHFYQRIYISRHVQFNEHCFPFANHTTPLDENSQTTIPNTLAVLPATSSTPHPNLHSSPSSPHTTPSSSSPSQLISAPTHSMTTRAKSNSLRPKQFPDHQLYNVIKHPLPSLELETEPTCYTQAVKTQHWRTAMASELNALATNNTWQLVEPPSNCNIVGSKLLFKIKRKADGTIERYKARLVAKGYTQEEGLDYFETFSPVVKPTTIRTVLTVALAQQWHIHQLDVNNAFLHGDLQETIYMQQPPGFVDPMHPHKVCLLQKALYGLKQAPRAWFHRLKTFLLSYNFICSKSDNSLFIFTNNTTVIYLLVYVDDIIITGNCISAIQDLIATLNSTFSIKDLGTLHYFLGIEVTSQQHCLYLTQTQYIHSLLSRTNMTGAKPCNTPMQQGQQLSKFSGIMLSDPTEYRMTVGALQYATITRPDNTFSVNKVSQFMASPTDQH
jgi:Reverse transcriptase (RNA-dependent DNA polymerase)